MIRQSYSFKEEFPYCVGGSGPVGMAIALELERLGKRVLVLEAGALQRDAVHTAATEAEIVDPQRHAAMSLSVCRVLGGTSWTWGGRCVKYDAVDWQERSWVPDSQWPIEGSEAERWYERASEYMLCGGGNFDFPTGKPLEGGITVETVERWTQEPKLILRHRARLLESQLIEISLQSTVRGLKLSADRSRVEALKVLTPEGEVEVRAEHILLAMGGVETTRLLLIAQEEEPVLFGASQGALGRYYMGHISGKIANIVFADPQSVAEMDFKQEADGTWYRRRYMLTAKEQRQEQLLNTAFWPDNPAFYDARHGSGVLSSVFLALAFPPTGRRLLSEAIRLVHTGPRPLKILPHLRNAVLGAPGGALDMYRILRDRLVRRPKKPGFLVQSKSGRYALHYHAEQIPQAQSRIELSEARDSFGMKRAKVDLRFAEQDVTSVKRSHEVLDSALRKNGIGHLEWMYPEAELEAKILEQAADGYHQAGSTRMGSDPRTSVVKENLQVHGVANLYVASSSVFCTSGQANSTFLAVAMAMRLVHELAEKPAMAELAEHMA